MTEYDWPSITFPTRRPDVVSMPARPSFRFFTLALPCWVAASNVLAAEPAPPQTEQAALRFPQPIRAGDLVGRTVVAPEERQPVLGRVVSIVRKSDGAMSVVIAESRWFGLGARPVAVPLAAVRLLGEYVALLDITPDQLSGMASFEAASAAEVPPDDTIRVGLVKPFH